MGAIETLREMDREAARRLLDPAYFDARFYRSQVELGAEADPFLHFLREGAVRGLRPNVAFDTGWYLEQNPEVARAGVNPLLHYVVVGEAEGRNPSPSFDARWYAETYAVATPLLHYLANRFGRFSPIPEFDAAYYLDANPDVATARLDPFLHYMHFGYREFRAPSASFNPRRYANRWLADDPGANPILDVRRRRPRLDEAAPPNAFDQVRASARPGRDFEPFAPPTPRPPRALLLAFHLTQFHRTTENDAWWGAGFTEWTLLSRGQPRFAGHYQPRAPGALGFYDLTDVEALRAQIRLAKAAGISGFVFYYYNFGGRRLLERPLEALLAAPDLDMPFCLMWANENWTRRWDGAEQEVLVAQSYAEGDEAQRCADLARHFRDPRYILLSGRPLLMIYRASLIPDVAAAVARWRRLFVERHGVNPIFAMAQTFDDLDPRPFGFDVAVEFPPHKLTKRLPQAYERIRVFDVGFEADVFAYDDVAAASLAEMDPPYPLIKTAVPSWDNDARRQGRGLTLAGASPLKYERWLSKLVERARARPIFGAAVVCVNAWNEWSEGAYLEPDVHFGAAYLNATARVAFGAAKPRAQIAFAGSGGRMAGLARQFKVAFGVDAVAADVSSARVVIFGPGGEAALELYAAAQAQTLYWPGGAAPSPRALLRANSAIFADESERRRAQAASPDWSGENAFVLPSSAVGDDEACARALFGLAFPTLAKVSAIVVADRTDERLAARLASVFAQTHPLWEVIVLETLEGGDAFATVSGCAREADRDATVMDARAEETSAAWSRALDAARGDLVWIADADGASDSEFVSRVARNFRDNPRIVAAFCDAAHVEAGVAPSLVAPRRTPSAVDETYDGSGFARLLARGVEIPSVGAALWRREVLARVLAEIGELPPGAGASALLRAAVGGPEGRLGYVAQTLEFRAAPRAGV